jgi:hypothetical protein
VARALTPVWKRLLELVIKYHMEKAEHTTLKQYRYKNSWG